MKMKVIHHLQNCVMQRYRWSFTFVMSQMPIARDQNILTKKQK